MGEIADLAKPHGIKVAAVVMVPSEKNRQSASIIGLDWSEYENNPVDFIKQSAKMAEGVLFTSPKELSDLGLHLLKQLNNDAIIVLFLSEISLFIESMTC